MQESENYMGDQDFDSDESSKRLEAKLDQQTGYILQMIREIGEMRADFNTRIESLNSNQ